MKPLRPSDSTHSEEDIASSPALARWKHCLSALRRLSQDPTDVQQIFVVGNALNLPTFQKMQGRFLEDPDGRRLFEEWRTIDSQSLDLDALRQLPPGSLGHEYARFLSDNALESDILSRTIHRRGAPVAYLVLRLRQSHDLWHVLTGFGVDVNGETQIQAFTYGNVGIPSSLVIAGLGPLGFRGFCGFRGKRLEVARKNLAAWRLGVRTRFLVPFPWEDHWQTPLELLRLQLNCLPSD